MSRPVTAHAWLRPGQSLIERQYLAGCVLEGQPMARIAQTLGLTVEVVEREIQRQGLWGRYCEARAARGETVEARAGPGAPEPPDAPEAASPGPAPAAPEGPGKVADPAALPASERLAVVGRTRRPRAEHAPVKTPSVAGPPIGALRWYQPGSGSGPHRTVTLRKTVSVSYPLKRELGAPCLVRAGLSEDGRWFVLARVPEGTVGALRLRDDKSTLTHRLRAWLRDQGVADGTYPGRVEGDGDSRRLVVDLQGGGAA